MSFLTFKPSCATPFDTFSPPCVTSCAMHDMLIKVSQWANINLDILVQQQLQVHTCEGYTCNAGAVFSSSYSGKEARQQDAAIAMPFCCTMLPHNPNIHASELQATGRKIPKGPCTNGADISCQIWLTLDVSTTFLRPFPIASNTILPKSRTCTASSVQL